MHLAAVSHRLLSKEASDNQKLEREAARNVFSVFVRFKQRNRNNRNVLSTTSL